MFVLTLAEEAFYFILSDLPGCSHPSLVTGRCRGSILTLLRVASSVCLTSGLEHN